MISEIEVASGSKATRAVFSQGCQDLWLNCRSEEGVSSNSSSKTTDRVRRVVKLVCKLRARPSSYGSSVGFVWPFSKCCLRKGLSNMRPSVGLSSERCGMLHWELFCGMFHASKLSRHWAEVFQAQGSFHKSEECDIDTHIAFGSPRRGFTKSRKGKQRPGRNDGGVRCSPIGRGCSCNVCCA